MPSVTVNRKPTPAQDRPGTFLATDKRDGCGHAFCLVLDSGPCHSAPAILYFDKHEKYSGWDLYSTVGKHMERLAIGDTLTIAL